VAITRAKNELYILHAKSRMLYGRTGANPPSRFLAEIPEELLDLPEKKQEGSSLHYQGQAASYRPQYQGNRDRITVGAPQRPAVKELEIFKPGQRVRHMLFGEGEILSVQKMGADYLYEIAFDTKGTKKLMATYAKLKKT